MIYKKRPMNADMAAVYLHHVERKGKALSLSAEQLNRWKAEYDKVQNYLNENFESYFAYMVSGGTNRLNVNTLSITMKELEEEGFIKEYKLSLKRGDAETFERMSKELRKRYNQMVDRLVAEWEKQQEGLQDEEQNDRSEQLSL